MTAGFLRHWFSRRDIVDCDSSPDRPVVDSVWLLGWRGLDIRNLAGILLVSSVSGW